MNYIILIVLSVVLGVGLICYNFSRPRDVEIKLSPHDTALIEVLKIDYQRFFRAETREAREAIRRRVRECPLDRAKIKYYPLRNWFSGIKNGTI